MGLMMMKSLFALAMLVAISMIGPQASAQESKSAWNTPPQGSKGAAFAQPVRIAGSLVGDGEITAGACTQGASNQCPAGHTCTCFTATAARFSSSRIGRGSANFFATIDGNASFGALGFDCSPVYGQIDVIATNDSPSFAVWGAACTDPQNNFATNGAMGLADSNLFIAHGYATYTGTINTHSGRVVLRFAGAAQ
jgi:hypothetical protein